MRHFFKWGLAKSCHSAPSFVMFVVRRPPNEWGRPWQTLPESGSAVCCQELLGRKHICSGVYRSCGTSSRTTWQPDSCTRRLPVTCPTDQVYKLDWTMGCHIYLHLCDCAQFWSLCRQDDLAVQPQHKPKLLPPARPPVCGVTVLIAGLCAGAWEHTTQLHKLESAL